MDEIVVKSVNISDKMNDQAVNMERIANEIETINGAVEETTAATQEEAATCKEGALEIENMKGNVSTQESVAKKLSGIVEGIDF